MILYCIHPILGDPIRVEAHHHEVTPGGTLNVLQGNGSILASFSSHDWRCIHVAWLPGWGCEVDTPVGTVTGCPVCEGITGANWHGPEGMECIACGRALCEQ